MLSAILLLAVIALAVAGYWIGRKRAVAIVTGGSLRELHSRPSYHGSYVAMWSAIPALAIAMAWLIAAPHVIEGMVINALPEDLRALPAGELDVLMNEVKNLADGYVAREPTPALQAAADHMISLRGISMAAIAVIALALVAIGLAFGWRKLSPGLRARNKVEMVIAIAMLACSTIAVITTFGIMLSLLFEAIRFFQMVPIWSFLFGLEWSPQIALRADQAGSSGAFGAVPLIVGTLLITFIALCVAGPIGLLAAIFMSNYADPRVRAVIKPLLEVLAGIPTVVYGFFAALTVAPLFRDIGHGLGFDVSSESALAAGSVMSIMIIPFISSLSDDVMSAVPRAMRDGSLALGSTKSEMIKQVILPAALPGIVGAFLLAFSFAIGETMIVVMAAGLAANLTINPFEAVTTVTVQIVTLLTGDQEFDSAKTLAAFALGLVLFIVTLLLNIVALRVVKKYREAYE